jgi:adenosylhomocysteine nucleosidase
MALGMELGGIIDRLSGVVTTQAAGFKTHHGVWRDRGVLLVESGIGRRLASSAIAAVIDGHRPPWVISSGFAGGLAEEVARLDIVVGNSVADIAGQRMAIDLKLDPAGQKGLHVGRMLTVDRIIRTPAEKRALAAEHAALTVDMETYAVAEVCRRERTRFMAIRVISDSVADELPRDLERLIDRPTMAGKLGAAAGAIVRRPSSVKDLWNLKEQALLATDKLAVFLLGMIEQLPVETPRAP